MANPIKIASALKEMSFKNYIYFSLVINLLTAGLVFAVGSFLPPVTPLLYGRPVGVGQLVPTLGLLIAPGVSFFITIINIILIIKTKSDFLKKVFFAAIVLTSVLTTITVIKIIFLVGFF